MGKITVCVIGGSGQLGRCLYDASLGRGTDMNRWVPSDMDLWFPSSADLNLVTMNGMDRLREFDVVVNLAAMHDLKQCQEKPGEAHDLNAYAIQRILDKMGASAHLYTISTDYVYGDPPPRVKDASPAPIFKRECDVPWPDSMYGQSKRVGEIIASRDPRATVIRTASLFSQYGSTGKGNRNFLLSMLQKVEGSALIEVADDVFMSPTYAPWLAECILAMIEQRDRRPLVHAVCKDAFVSWMTFAVAIFETGRLYRASERVVGTPCDQSIPRPRVSALKQSDLPRPLGTVWEALEHYFSVNQKEA